MNLEWRARPRDEGRGQSGERRSRTDRRDVRRLAHQVRGGRRSDPPLLQQMPASQAWCVTACAARGREPCRCEPVDVLLSSSGSRGSGQRGEVEDRGPRWPSAMQSRRWASSHAIQGQAMQANPGQPLCKPPREAGHRVRAAEGRDGPSAMQSRHWASSQQAAPRRAITLTGQRKGRWAISPGNQLSHSSSWPTWANDGCVHLGEVGADILGARLAWQSWASRPGVDLRAKQGKPLSKPSNPRFGFR